MARQALKDQRDAEWLRIVLAVSLIEQRKNIDEALAYVGRAVTKFPSARLFAATAFVHIGRIDLAVMQVKEVLGSQAEHPCEKAALENWVAAAKQRQAAQD